MLQLRIEALSHHLEQAQHPDAWKQKLELNTFDVDDDLWDNAVEEIYNVAHGLHTRLREVERQLDAEEISQRQAWRRYELIHVASEDVFRECLDLLGGLALRDRIQDERICRIADEYIKELASATVRRESFSIPGLDARLSSTLRRVAKMQFPEWTVWTLPLVAHEYGHVVIEKSGLKSYAASLSRKFAEEDIRQHHAEVLAALVEGRELGLVLELLASRDGVEVEAQFQARGIHAADTAEHFGDAGPVEVLREVFERHTQRVRVLLADALATLLAGPAYAYAALLLRLNPLADERQLVSDHERAATILAVLRFTNQPSEHEPPLHGDVVEKLAEYWRQSVADAEGRPRDEVTPELDAAPPIDPAEIQENFKAHLVSHRRAAYERRHSEPRACVGAARGSAISRTRSGWSRRRSAPTSTSASR